MVWWTNNIKMPWLCNNIWWWCNNKNGSVRKKKLKCTKWECNKNFNKLVWPMRLKIGRINLPWRTPSKRLESAKKKNRGISLAAVLLCLRSWWTILILGSRTRSFYISLRGSKKAKLWSRVKKLKKSNLTWRLWRVPGTKPSWSISQTWPTWTQLSRLPS